MADVFISYSRKDIDFAKRIVSAIYDSGHEDVWVDWEDIPPTADWLNEIYSGIEKADNFIFIVTEHSLISKICNVELKHARENHKRIIPIIRQNVDLNSIKEQWSGKEWQEIADANWTDIERINWIFAGEDVEFTEMFTKLIKTIETDLAHVKSHTHFQIRALDWQRANENPSFLLTGDEIDRAEDWLEGASEKDPFPTDLHRQFIRDSRDRDLGEKRRLRNLRLTSVVAGLIGTVAIIATIFAFFSQQEANQRLDEVENTIVPATLNAVSTNVQNAENDVTSLQIVSRAQDIYNGGDIILGLSLALESSYIASPPQTERILSQLAYARSIHKRFNVLLNPESALAYSPDGLQIASLDRDGSVILWDVTNGAELRHLDSNHVRALAFSPDSVYLLSGGDNNAELILWDVASGEEVRRFEGEHTDEIVGVAYSPDGSKILSSSEDDTVVVWDVETGEKIRQVGQPEAVSTNLAFSPDGSRFIVASRDGFVLRHALSGREILRFEGHNGSINGIAYSSDGSYIASAASDSLVILWDALSGIEIRRFEGHNTFVNSVAFSYDGGYLVTGGGDNNIAELILWDVASGREIHRYLGHTDSVESVAFSPDGSQILSVTRNTLNQWDVVIGSEVRRYQGYRSVSYSPDGSKIVSVGRDNSLILWAAVSGREVRRFEGHSSTIWSLAFSPDGRQIASASSDNSVILWDVVSGREIRRFEGHLDVVRSVAFSPNGRYVLSGSDDHKLMLWDTGTGRQIQQFEGHSRINSVAFSPNGHQVASGNSDSLILWDIATGQEIQQFESNIRSVAFSPDGRQIISGSNDRNLILWDIATGQEIRRFEGHLDSVISVAFSPDGGQVVSGSLDTFVILWDVASGGQLRRFEDHLSSVRSVAFSPDTLQILSVSDDSNVILWRNDSLEVLQEWIISNRILGDITCEQRIAYGLDNCDESGTPPPSPSLAPTRTHFPLPVQGGFTFTPIPSFTPTYTPTLTATRFITNTLSPSPTLTSTLTQTATLTQTPTLTSTPMPTLTPVPTGVPIRLPDGTFDVIKGEILGGGSQQYIYSNNEGLNIYLNSNDFDTYLRVYDNHENLIAENDDLNQYNSGIENLFLPENEEVIIEVSGFYGFVGGDYSLVIEPIEFSEIALGTIEDEIRIGGSKFYTYRGFAPVSIYLNSLDFDTYLSVYDNSGNKIAENDDLIITFSDTDYNNSYMGFDSGVINLILPEDGEIIIEVRTYWLEEGGEYTLTIEEAEVVSAAIELSPAESGEIQGELDTGAYQRYIYSGDLPVNIYLSSSDFDTYLYIYDSNGNLLEENDDFNDLNSGFENLTLPQDGEVVIHVHSYADQEGGEYTLTIEQIEITESDN